MAEIDNELLQTFIEQQARILAGHREMRTAIGVIQVSVKKLRSETRAARGEFRALSSKVGALSDDLNVHTTSIEELEEQSGQVLAEFAKVHSRLGQLETSIDGVVQLAKSAYDLNASTLSGVAKMKRHVVVEEASAPADDSSAHG